jgi:hypothetical protein
LLYRGETKFDASANSLAPEHLMSFPQPLNLMAETIDDVAPATPTFGELERELRRVEQSIATLSASDAFVEDLISCHAYRKALVAALANWPRKRWPMIDDVDWSYAPSTPEWLAQPRAWR